MFGDKLVFTSRANDRIGTIDVGTGDITTFVDPAGGLDEPTELAASSETSFAWFTSPGNDRIGSINLSSGRIRTVTDPAIDDPAGIAISRTSTWFTNTGTGTVAEYRHVYLSSSEMHVHHAPPGEVVAPAGTASFYGFGPGTGEVWFVDTATDRVGRYSLERCDGRPPDVYIHRARWSSGTVIGIAGDDRIEIFGRDVRVCGRGGHDVILGGSGPERLFGEAGDDVIRPRGRGGLSVGGPGDDILIGGADRDDLRGGPGDDYLFGGEGVDRLDGGPGNDVCFGGRQPDVAFACERVRSAR